MPYQPIYLWEITVIYSFTAVTSRWDSSPWPVNGRPRPTGPSASDHGIRHGPRVQSHEPKTTTEHCQCGSPRPPLSTVSAARAAAPAAAASGRHQPSGQPDRCIDCPTQRNARSVHRESQFSAVRAPSHLTQTKKCRVCRALPTLAVSIRAIVSYIRQVLTLGLFPKCRRSPPPAGARRVHEAQRLAATSGG